MSLPSRVASSTVDSGGEMYRSAKPRPPSVCMAGSSSGWQKHAKFAFREGASMVKSTHPANVWGDHPIVRKAVQNDPVELHLPAPLQPPVAAAKTLSLVEDFRVHSLHSADD